MGTRSLTRVISNNKQLVNMYRQMDGYPSGHGADLFKFLDGMVVGNGLGSNMPPKYANGAGCLAAQLVAHFKDEPGGFYLVAGQPGDHGQEYDYVITADVDNPVIRVKVRAYNRSIFEGTVAEFGAWCDRKED